MRLTLSCDHRLVDGVVGSKFLNTLKDMKLKIRLRTIAKGCKLYDCSIYRENRNLIHYFGEEYSQKENRIL